MKNSIKIAIVAAIAAVGLAACTTTPAQEQNAAPAPQPQSSETSAPPPSVVTEVVTSTVTNPPKPQSAVGTTDSRPGYGALKLGMTLEEAHAAGLTTLTWDGNDGDPDCVGDAKVAISKKHGVVRITLPAEAKTSKGIGTGSTFGDVKKAYPNAQEYRGGFSARVTDQWGYAFKGSPGSDANKVETITISSSLADCSMYLL
jgi:hypothetical protein